MDELLQTMELIDKTDYLDGQFTNLNLSTRIREGGWWLALIIALDKPIE